MHLSWFCEARKDIRGSQGPRVTHEQAALSRRGVRRCLWQGHALFGPRTKFGQGDPDAPPEGSAQLECFPQLTAGSSNAWRHTRATVCSAKSHMPLRNKTRTLRITIFPKSSLRAPLRAATDRGRCRAPHRAPSHASRERRRPSHNSHTRTCTERLRTSLRARAATRVSVRLRFDDHEQADALPALRAHIFSG